MHEEECRKSHCLKIVTLICVCTGMCLLSSPHMWSRNKINSHVCFTFILFLVFAHVEQKQKLKQKQVRQWAGIMLICLVIIIITQACVFYTR